MSQNKLLEIFKDDILNSRLQWHCPPAAWNFSENRLHIISKAETDFWQRTHYGFRADNGHFLFAELDGDFSMEAGVHCEFKHQYDQAGLMVRVSDECWIKSSIEYELHEPNKLGAVVTNNGFSDWSTQDVDDSMTEYRLRIERRGSDYKVTYFNVDTDAWVQLRLGHLFDSAVVKAGIYACSPQQGGFSAFFNYLKIE